MIDYSIKKTILLLSILLPLPTGNILQADSYSQDYSYAEIKMHESFLERLSKAEDEVQKRIEERSDPVRQNSLTHSFPTTSTIKDAKSSVEAGVRQLYLKEELQNILTIYRRDIDGILNAWLAVLNTLARDFKTELQSLQTELEALQLKLVASPEDDQISGLIQLIREKINSLTVHNKFLDFTKSYRLKAFISRFSLEVQKLLLSGKVNLDNVNLLHPDEKKLPEIYNQISRTVEELRHSFKQDILSEFDSLFKDKPTRYYDSWSRNFTYGGQEYIDRFNKELEEYKTRLIQTLQSVCLIKSKQDDFVFKLQRSNLFTPRTIPYFVKNTTKNQTDGLYFSLGYGVEGKYSYDTAGLIIYPTGGYDSLLYSPTLVCLHGACTFHSNVKSFSDLVRIGKVSYFLNISALDIWGSMEKLGIAIDLSSSSPEQLAFYLEHFYQSMLQKSPTLKESPFIVGGRSSGSSSEFIHAFYHHMAQKPISTDLLYLVSFSNFLTSDFQLKSVQEQERQGLLALVPDSSKRVQTLYDSVIKDLELVRTQTPDLLVSEGFADNIFYVQGRRDLDGGPTVVDDLIRFSTKYTPLAHIYVFDDPLAKYPEFAKFLEQYGQGEASHFLYNSHPNMTLEWLEQKLPPEVRSTLPKDKTSLIKLLPRYKDQLSEVIALKYAALDYLILSPFTKEDKKKELIQKRYNLTGSYDKFAYFRWFVEQEGKRIQETKKDISPISFEQIQSSTSAMKESILYRYQKVYKFILQELKYANDLYSKFGISGSYDLIRTYNINKLIKTRLLVTEYGYSCVGLFKKTPQSI